MSKLTYVNIDDLKVGDVVGFCRYPSFGWRRCFRYPIVTNYTIERITPKRTKFVLKGGIELNEHEARGLVIPDEESKRQSEVAKTFSDLKNIQNKLDEAGIHGNHIIEIKLLDEELIEYHKMMKSIYDKYLGGE